MIYIVNTKTGYYPYEANWTVTHEEARASGRYGMYWIVAMQEVRQGKAVGRAPPAF